MTGEHDQRRSARAIKAPRRETPKLLHPVISAIKSDLANGVQQGAGVDLAFIGNTSEVYDWAPCFMVDLDAFVFADGLDQRLGGGCSIWRLGGEPGLNGKTSILNSGSSKAPTSPP